MTGCSGCRRRESGRGAALGGALRRAGDDGAAVASRLEALSPPVAGAAAGAVVMFLSCPWEQW